MRKGRWINLIREGILKMNQPEFAKWLTQSTGVPVDASMVGKIESWGSVDIKKKNTKKVIPDPKIINLLESIFGVKTGNKILATRIIENTEEKEENTEEYYISSVTDTKNQDLIPIVYGYPAALRLNFFSREPKNKTLEKHNNSKFIIHVVSQATENLITNARVRFYSKRGTLQEDLTTYTDENGNAEIYSSTKNTNSMHFGSIRVDASLSGHWDYYQPDVTLHTSSPFNIELERVVIPSTSSVLSHFHSESRRLDQNCVPKVGVIDTGIDFNHPDLNVIEGFGFYSISSGTTSHADNGVGHGTHVAGIIGSSNQDSLGMAPGTSLISYRIFPDRSPATSNRDENINQGIGATFLDLRKAIIHAVNHECDIINISLDFDFSLDEYLDRKTKISSIKQECNRAFNRGIVVVAAAGNKARSKVAYPAAIDTVVGVSAMGRKNTVCHHSYDNKHFGLPKDISDHSNRFGKFSNYCKSKKNIQFVASGIGITSTIIGGGYGVMTGTSMACAVVSGVLANLLSQNPTIYNMPRNQERAIAMLNLLKNSDNLKNLNFGKKYQGDGMPVLK